VNFIIAFFYEMTLWIIALFALPKLAYHYLFHKKYRNSFLARFGSKILELKKNNAPIIWIHAVSLGETKAVVSLAREIKRLLPSCSIMISSTTETGHAEAKRSLPFADHHVYLPFDFNSVISRTVKQVSPALVILCESDFWYNFLRSSKKVGASVALVNGKISERSANRFNKVPFFSKRLFGLFNTICTQNSLYQKRLMEAGAPEDSLVVTGNLKFDDDYPQLSPEEVKKWRNKLGIDSHQLVLTIGSTHHPEEQLFIQILKEVWKKVPHLKVILVPRHPERFKTVGALLENARINWISFTDIARRSGNEQVILIDAMGMLRMCYQLSDLSLVGGSFIDKVGGHNILEPCWYGKPVIFGPHMHTQLELVHLINQSQAGEQVTELELQSALERLLLSSKQRQKIGEKGAVLIKELKGSTQRTIAALDPLLQKIIASEHIRKQKK
jgi:3-deoxy-D-manno-octulosonic-acid transferase